MLCLTCARVGPALCDGCIARLTPAPDRMLEFGLLVRSAFRHEGPAQTLVHHFKYRGSNRAGWVLASALAPLVPSSLVLVPVPRSSWRHLRYGIDPAPDLAHRLQRLTGCTVAHAFVAPVASPRQAGRKRAERLTAPLRLAKDPGPLVTLLDDVLTTGATLTAAQTLLLTAGIRVEGAITATVRGD